MEHQITEKVIPVDITREPPAGFRLVSPWPAILREYLEPMLYPYIGRRENIRPKSFMLREYTERSYEEFGYTERPRFVTDRYARIGNTYVCSRTYNGREHMETLTIEMRLSDELKEAIVAGALKPSRLQKWLEKGWEEEWYTYFSR